MHDTFSSLKSVIYFRPLFFNDYLLAGRSNFLEILSLRGCQAISGDSYWHTGSFPNQQFLINSKSAAE